MVRREYYLAWVWGLVLLACGASLAWLLQNGLPADTRLTAMLPEDRQSPLIEHADRQLGSGFEDRFVLLLASPDLKADAQALANTLATPSTGQVSAEWLDRLDWRDTDLADADPRQALGEFRYRLLTPALREAISASGGQALVEPALREFFSPAGQPEPVVDPFGLLDHWLMHLDGNPVQSRNGLLTVMTPEHTYAVLIGRLATSPYDLSTQQALSQALTDFERTHPEASLLRSGLIFHAAAGAQQARQEIKTIGLGAMTGLVLVLLAVFRSPRTLLHMFLPLTCGLLFALPLTLVLFGQLHLLTLAFGASLIGIAIDYALHVQCHRAVQGPVFRLRSLMPGLILGLVSSLLAYLAQALTPLPGLRQMAVFAALGLAGAWLTVVLWLPQLRMMAHPVTTRLAQRLWQYTMPRRRLPLPLALVIALAAAGIVAWQLQTDDSLRLLNPSPAALIDQERQVQSLLGSDTGNRYLLVTAENESALLSRLASLGATFDAWIAEGASFRYTNLADSVPPPEVQRDNLDLVHQLYSEPLSSLITKAGLPESTAERARAKLDDVPILEIADWLRMPAGSSQQRLWLGEFPDASGQVAAILPLSDIEPPVEQRLANLAGQHADVTYVDRIERISGLLSQLRKQIALWVAAAVTGLALLLALRYRRRTWRVLTPPIGAILGVLTAFALTGVPLNVFSQLGLLLVLGIGLDAGIFSVEHARRPETWLAISLSTLTSLLAFGLLAFSETPALHYLGISCLIGLTLVWLLVPWVRPRYPSSSRESQHAK